ncbi:MAG: hypothetical protein KAS66_07200 [Candidatus Omnitrophica bacterium]|nr:hypothetical protein [Candidatus Omnitrophota bacterium]
MNDKISNPQDMVRKLKKSLKKILKKSDCFYLALKDIAFDDDQSLKQKINAAEQLLKSSQEEWMTHIMMEEKWLFPFLSSRMPKVKATVLSLQEKCKTIKVNFEVVQYLCWELTSGGTGMKRSLTLSKLKTSGRKLVAMIDSYLNLEAEYVEKFMTQNQSNLS